MAAPKTTTWALEEHTRAKHVILKRYLDAWMPILSHGGFPRIVFIDGFAGPGVYDDGSEGSPIIALRTYLTQAPTLTARVDFHFVEFDRRRAALLQQTLDDVLATFPPQPRLGVTVHAGRNFDEVYNSDIHPNLPTGAPVFAFIDPFGWRISMTTIARIMALDSSEVLVNFMFEEINRFISHPDQVDNFDTLFGCEDWRRIAVMEGRARRDGLRDLFSDRLRTIGRARYVRHFEMRNKRSQTDYFLYFATRKLKGLAKMKESMWKADPSGDFRFSDATNTRQLVLFGEEVDFGRLERQLRERFADEPCGVQEIEAFVVEETAFRETHYKSVLRDMEAAGRLEIVWAKSGRRRGTFPAGTIVRLRARESTSQNDMLDLSLPV